MAALAWAVVDGQRPIPTHGEYVKAECAKEAGPERDSQEMCMAGKLLGRAFVVGR
jgi:hypothetical protein